MTEQEALRLMVAPGTPRPGKYRNGVIQILVTSSCDKSCFACTQASNVSRKPWFMSPDHFEKALVSLEGWWGVVGIFGGNPAISPHFETYCDLLSKYFPREQRGLWCNHPMGKGSAMRRTFDPKVSNLNVHLDADAYKEFKDTWPESMPFGLTQDSRHSPPFVAMKDVIPDEGVRWDLISRCPINIGWSSLLGVFRGQLRAWFCEIAGSQSILHQDDPDYPDTGLDPSVEYEHHTQPGSRLEKTVGKWWELPMQAFAGQVRRHCMDCGIPMNGYGELAQRGEGEGKEQVSQTHAGVYKPKRKGRAVELVTTVTQLGTPLEDCTKYLSNARK